MSHNDNGLRFVAGFRQVSVIAPASVVLNTDASAGWSILTAREWAILLAALEAGDEEIVASRSTTILRSSLEFSDRLAALDLIAPWCAALVLAVHPRLRPYRSHLMAVSVAEARECIASLVRRGALVPLETGHTVRNEPEPPVISIATCDRPAALARLLRVLCGGAYEGTVPDVHVCDSSSSETTATTNQALCDASGPRVRYVGARERHSLIHDLVTSGVDPRIATFALAGLGSPAIRANRNLCLLSAVGRRVLMLDDDLVPHVWVPWETHKSVRLTCATDPRSVAFAASKERLFSGLVRRPEALWQPHAAVIGVALSRVLKAQQDVDAVIPESSMARSWGTLVASGRIRATLHGTVGHCGSAWFRELLLLEGPSRASLVQQQAIYEAACANGVSRRTTACIQISPNGNYALGGMGLDCRDTLPPFLSSYQCDDVLFLNTLRRTDPLSLVAFLPATTEHWPINHHRRSPDARFEQTGLRVFELVDWIAGCEATVGSADSTSIEALGRRLHAVRGWPRSRIADYCHEAWIHHASTWLSRTDRALTKASHSPTWWANDVRRLRERIKANLCAITYLPTDLDPSVADPVSSIQNLIATFGALLESWPTLWDVARRRSLSSAAVNGMRGYSPVRTGIVGWCRETERGVTATAGGSQL